MPAPYRSIKQREAVRKMSEANRGRPLSSAHKSALSAILKGKPKPPRSPEHRAKLSAIAKGRVASPEHRAKISASLKGRAKNPQTHCCRGHLLSPDNVYTDSRGKRRCKECRKGWMANDAKRRKGRGQCRKCAEPIALGNSNYCEGHRQMTRGYVLKNRYGITPAQYQYMLDQQGGVCPICKQPPTDSRGLVLDHNHRTEVIRGLLHASCNQALGLLKDNPDIILAASQYVRSSGVMA